MTRQITGYRWKGRDWVLAVEQAYGMDVAVGLDNQVWEQFSAIEADGIKQRLSLPECRGLDTPRIALNNML